MWQRRVFSWWKQGSRLRKRKKASRSRYIHQVSSALRGLFPSTQPCLLIDISPMNSSMGKSTDKGYSLKIHVAFQELHKLRTNFSTYKSSGEDFIVKLNRYAHICLIGMCREQKIGFLTFLFESFLHAHSTLWPPPHLPSLYPPAAVPPSIPPVPCSLPTKFLSFCCVAVPLHCCW